MEVSNGEKLFVIEGNMFSVEYEGIYIDGASVLIGPEMLLANRIGESPLSDLVECAIDHDSGHGKCEFGKVRITIERI